MRLDGNDPTTSLLVVTRSGRGPGEVRREEEERKVKGKWVSKLRERRSKVGEESRRGEMRRRRS